MSGTSVSKTMPLRVLFVVQGEGRGHMTQALALADMLRRSGHTVCRTVVGQSKRRRIPTFFSKGIGSPITLVPSPNFIADSQGTIRVGMTVASGAMNAPNYVNAARLLEAVVQEDQPDVIINFYESLVPLWSSIHRSDIPVLAIAHQFMFEHPDYPFPPGKAIQRVTLQQYTRLVGKGASLRLALSFYDIEATTDGTHHVVPPLMRTRVLSADTTDTDGSVLVYLVEPALAEGLKEWSDKRPGVPIHCFWDGPAYQHSRGLRFHALDGEHFLQRMERCIGVVCTAGFESVSEARWMNKPILMIPVKGHYEQICNAYDAMQHGIGLKCDTMDLDQILDTEPTERGHDTFRTWVLAAEKKITQLIEEAVYAKSRDKERAQDIRKNRKWAFG